VIRHLVFFVPCFYILLFVSNYSHSSDIQTLFIAGDSTAASYNNGKQQGWGAKLSLFLNSNHILVENRAVGAKSSRTYITEGYWKDLIDDVKPGDWVLIQFGHNDLSDINDKRRARGTLPGIGDKSIEIDNLLTGKKETVYTFGHYIQQMITDVKRKKAKPILLTLTVRNIWAYGRIERQIKNYNAWLYEIALKNKSSFIDVTNLAADKLERLGENAVSDLYPKDHTHFNEATAELYAETIISAIKGMKPTLNSNQYSSLGESVEASPWTFVRLPIIQDSLLPSLFLIGDSTVRNGTGIGEGGEWGWGAFLDEQLDGNKINVINRAIGGFSSRSYITGGLWHQALNMMKPGDFVLIQFGHNDSKPINDKKRPRGTLPGVSNQSIDIINNLTGQAESVGTYGSYLRKMIGEALARGIKPIICSPVPRKMWNKEKNKIIQKSDSYQHWAKSVAETSGVSFIDLYQLISSEYNNLGPEKVEGLFADKYTHTNREGAMLNAKIVAKALKPILSQQ
jgi:lysophospholipase L1-like esterase